MIREHQPSNIKLFDTLIPLQIIKGRKHQIRLSFSDENILTVESHSGILGEEESDFINTRAKWIHKIFHLRQKQQVQRVEFLSKVHLEIPLFGIAHSVEFLPFPSTKFSFQKGETLVVYAPQSLIKNQTHKLLYYALRQLAMQYLPIRIQKWADICEVQFNDLRVKDHKSKWGSCSDSGNINLNFYLMFLEEAEIDYILVHELMHLREMNHGRNFWNWVENYIPNYKSSIKKVREKEWIIGTLK